MYVHECVLDKCLHCFIIQTSHHFTRLRRYGTVCLSVSLSACLSG